jgi:hypothetical protein
MHQINNLHLRAILRTAIAVSGVALCSTSVQAGTIVHRYEFNGNVADSVGTYNGTLTGNTTNLETPLFGPIVPTGASGPTQSIEFGMNDGSKKSCFTLAPEVISSQAAAGSVSMFIRPEATTSGGFRYAFAALPSGGGFNFGQITSGPDQVLRDAVNNTIVGNFTMTPDTWYHVALTWEQSGPDLITAYYVDGSQIAQPTISPGSITGLTTIRVGTFSPFDNSDNLANQFDGRMYDLQIYDDVLTSSQVSFLANNPGIPVPEPSSFAILAGALGVLTLWRHHRQRD